MSSRAMLDLDTEPKSKDQSRKRPNMLKSLVSKVSNTKFTSKLPRRCPPTHSCSTIGSHSIAPMQQSESHFKSVSVNNRDLDPIRRFRTLGLNPFNVFKKKEAPTKSLKIHLEGVQDTDYVMDLTRKESSESRAPSAPAEAAMEPSNIGGSQPITETKRTVCTATENHGMPVNKNTNFPGVSHSLPPPSIPRWALPTVVNNAASVTGPARRGGVSGLSTGIQVAVPTCGANELASVDNIVFASQHVKNSKDTDEEVESDIEDLILQLATIAEAASLLPKPNVTSGDLCEVSAPTLDVERGHVENHNLYTHNPLVKPRMAPYPKMAEQFKQVIGFKYEKGSTRRICGSEEHESLLHYAQPQCWPSVDSILQIMGNTMDEDHADILRMLSTAGPLPNLMSLDEGLVQMQRAAASGLDEPWPSGSAKSPGSKYTPTSQCPIPDHRNARPVKSALRGTASSFANTQISE